MAIDIDFNKPAQGQSLESRCSNCGDRLYKDFNSGSIFCQSQSCRNESVAWAFIFVLGFIISGMLIWHAFTEEPEIDQVNKMKHTRYYE